MKHQRHDKAQTKLKENASKGPEQCIANGAYKDLVPKQLLILGNAAENRGLHEQGIIKETHYQRIKQRIQHDHSNNEHCRKYVASSGTFYFSKHTFTFLLLRNRPCLPVPPRA